MKKKKNKKKFDKVADSGDHEEDNSNFSNSFSFFEILISLHFFTLKDITFVLCWQRFQFKILGNSESKSREIEQI